jgi:hypothetical protein
MSNKFTINLRQPGPVLQDFSSLLDFIGSEGQLVSKKQMVFSTKSLLELNPEMTHPIEQDQKRPQQSGFPHISILYHCAKWLGYFLYTDEGTRKRVTLNPVAITSWNQLNYTEQYFTLLQLWLFGDPDGSYSPPIRRLDRFKNRYLRKTKAYYRSMLQEEYRIGELVAGLELFGFIEVEHANPDPGCGWKIDSLKWAPAGKSVFTVLQDNNEHDDVLAFYHYMHMFIDDESEGIYNVFQPHFPELQNHFSMEQEEALRPGVYIFKVSLGKVWRRIAIDHQETLEDLANVILYAFDFDKDHLYGFGFNDTSGFKREYFSPMIDDADAFTDEISLEELPLSIKASMKFLFDFGDRWEFKVLLEKVDPDGEKVEVAEIIAAGGEAPEQYPVSSDEMW